MAVAEATVRKMPFGVDYRPVGSGSIAGLAEYPFVKIEFALVHQSVASGSPGVGSTHWMAHEVHHVDNGETFGSAYPHYMTCYTNGMVLLST